MEYNGIAFEKENYSGTKIKGYEYDNCTFHNCDFSNSSFSDCKFRNCKFDACNLSMMKLVGTSLNNIHYKDCKILGVIFSDCHEFLFSPQFQNCILDYASFMDRKMNKTKFNGSSMKDVNFFRADLTGCSFEGCNLEGAVFNGTVLNNTDFVTASNYTIDPELNKLKGARFSRYGVERLLDKYGIIIE